MKQVWLWNVTYQYLLLHSSKDFIDTGEQGSLHICVLENVENICWQSHAPSKQLSMGKHECIYDPVWMTLMMIVNLKVSMCWKNVLWIHKHHTCTWRHSQNMLKTFRLALVPWWSIGRGMTSPPYRLQTHSNFISLRLLPKKSPKMLLSFFNFYTEQCWLCSLCKPS